MLRAHRTFVRSFSAEGENRLTRRVLLVHGGQWARRHAGRGTIRTVMASENTAEIFYSDGPEFSERGFTLIARRCSFRITLDKFAGQFMGEGSAAFDGSNRALQSQRKPWWALARLWWKGRKLAALWGVCTSAAYAGATVATFSRDQGWIVTVSFDEA